MANQFAIRVRDPKTKAVLFEATSVDLEPFEVCRALALPEDDPEIWGYEHDASPAQGRRLLQMIGKDYAGPGTFTVCHERAF
jgi:hypothetical protein